MLFTRLPVLFIGLRYLLTRRANRFFSLTSLIAVAGLALGVTALILVLSVFNGSQGIQRERTLITVPHAALQAEPGFINWQEAAAVLQELPSIRAVAPYIALEGLLSSRGNHQVSEVRGILPDAELQVSTLATAMVQGRLSSLQAGSHQIVIGRTLASALRLYPGDAVNLAVPQSNAASTQASLEIHRFTVSGIFDVNFHIGADLAYVHLEDAKSLLGNVDPDTALQLRLEVEDIHQARQTLAQGLQQLDSTLPGPRYAGEDWSSSEAALFNALKLEKIMTGFMLMMIVAIGAFNIVSTLVMSVADKQADIAILRTMGAGQRTIMGIFVVQGALAGVAGVLLGAVVGITLVVNFEAIGSRLQGWLSPDTVYLINQLPAELQGSDVWLTCGVALLISFLATLYPAWKAGRIHPAQVLRYE